MTMSVNGEKSDTRREVRDVSIAPASKRPVQLGEKSPADWPEFGEYARLKYPEELDEGLVVLIERLIEERGTLSG